MFEPLYEMSEQAQVSFFGFVSESVRYDFAMVYTLSFFGKPLVICMQTGCSALIGAEDLSDYAYLHKSFRMKDLDSAAELSAYLATRLPPMAMAETY